MSSQTHTTNGIWGECGRLGRNSILGLQKSAVRNIADAKYNSHTDPLFKKLEILKISDLYITNGGTLMFNVAKGSQPNTITSIFKQSSTSKGI